MHPDLRLQIGRPLLTSYSFPRVDAKHRQGVLQRQGQCLFCCPAFPIARLNRARPADDVKWLSRVVPLLRGVCTSRDIDEPPPSFSLFFHIG